METTKLSSKGQVIDMGDGVLLKAKSLFEETSVEDVAGCLIYKGPAKSLDAMEEAIRAGLKTYPDDD